MKRKLGIALLIIATVLAGTPEALSQFHTVGLALRQWAGKNFGGSFLVYAADTGERGLPDRYDYHMVAPASHKNGGEVMASLSLSQAVSGHDAATCHFAQPQRTEARAPKAAPHAKHTLLPPAPPRLDEQTARLRAEREARRAQARELARVLRETFRTLGGEFSGAGFVAPANQAELAAKLKALRAKPSVETIKLRRAVPVKVALNETNVPAASGAPVSCPIATTSIAPVYTYTYSLDADRDRR